MANSPNVLLNGSTNVVYLYGGKLFTQKEQGTDKGCNMNGPRKHAKVKESDAKDHIFRYRSMLELGQQIGYRWEQKRLWENFTHLAQRRR